MAKKILTRNDKVLVTRTDKPIIYEDYSIEGVNLNKDTLNLDIQNSSLESLTIYDSIPSVSFLASSNNISLDQGDVNIYYNTAGRSNVQVKNVVDGSISDNILIPENIKKGVTIFNVTGNCTTLKKYLDLKKSAASLFSGLSNETSFDDIIQYDDTENVTNMYNMFYNCKSLTKIPLLNTSKVTNMENMCYYNQNITYFPELDTSNVTNMSRMFAGCTRLTIVSRLDTHNVLNMQEMFSENPLLKTITELNLIKVTNTSAMFYKCFRLTNLTLLNIKPSLTIDNNDSNSQHLLTLDSLINTIKELVNVGSARTLTMGTANLEKITNTYVRRTTEGDIPTCLDDNSNIDLAKGPCEVCASDDLGAMTITAYANLKGWTLA